MFGPYEEHSAAITCAAFCAEPTTALAVGGDDRIVTFYTLPLACDVANYANDVDASGNGFRAESAVDDSEDAVWQPQFAARTAVLSAYSVSCVNWHPLKPLLIAACRDGSLHALDAAALPRVTPVDTLSLPQLLRAGLSGTRTRWDDPVSTAAARVAASVASNAAGDVVADFADSTQHVLAMMLVQNRSVVTRTEPPAATGAKVSMSVETVLSDSSEWVLCCGSASIVLHGGSFALKRLLPRGGQWSANGAEGRALAAAAARCGVTVDPPGPFLAGTAACAVAPLGAAPIAGEQCSTGSHGLADVADTTAAAGALVCVLGGMLSGDVACAALRPIEGSDWSAGGAFP